MGRLTTHVLDTNLGRPAAGMMIELWKIAEPAVNLVNAVTNSDGRVNEPLLKDENFQAGIYELRFHAGDYLRGTGSTSDDPAFLDVIPVRFGISNSEQHFHVPLLLSSHGYSTYRGS